MYSKIPLIGRQRRVAAVTSLSHPVTPSERHRPRRAARTELAKIDKKRGARAARHWRPLKSYTGNRISAVGRRRRPAHCHGALPAGAEGSQSALRTPAAHTGAAAARVGATRSIRPQARRRRRLMRPARTDTLFRRKNGARALLPIIVGAVMDSGACFLSGAAGASRLSHA